MIQFADPWLPRGFDWFIDVPDRFVAENMSASASTVFIIDKTGRMFTRLIDWDTRGDNPFLPYSYVANDVVFWFYQFLVARGLPGHSWQEQPRISGSITQNITILQTGVGNAERELRVEGVDAQGSAGYFHKKIFDPEWSFRVTGQPLQAHLLDPFAVAEDVESYLKDYTLDAIRGWKGSEVPRIELLQFSIYSEPALIRVWIGEEAVDLKLWMRKLKFSNDKKKAKLRGMIEIPEKAPAAVRKGLGEERWLEVDVYTKQEGEKSEQVKIRTRGFFRNIFSEIKMQFSRLK